MISSSHLAKTQREHDLAKRAFDLLFATVALILLAPALALLAVLVKLDSPGPVFYRGVRTGRHGISFRIFKFRTMVPHAELIGGGSTAKSDPRITKIGLVLRKYKLDELPQLINILKGHMSVVGPRPELAEHTRCYSEDEHIILSVRPGLTDYASLQFLKLSDVLGDGNADEAYLKNVRPTKNRLRVKYVLERTFIGDLKLIAVTLFAILRQKPWST